MDKKKNTYAPPKGKVYQFDNNECILTESGVMDSVVDYAANALNEFMAGTNTTIE